MTAVNGVARFEVQAGDVEMDTGSPRCELSGGGPDLNQGDDVWVLDKFRWGADDTANPPWELVNQWHDGGANGSQFSPSLALFRYGTNVRLINGKGSPVYWNGGSVERGIWQTLVYHYVPSTGANGKVEAWWNGTKVADFAGKTLNTEDAYLKIGINRSNSTASGTAS